MGMPRVQLASQLQHSKLVWSWCHWWRIDNFDTSMTPATNLWQLSAYHPPSDPLVPTAVAGSAWWWCLMVEPSKELLHMALRMLEALFSWARQGHWDSLELNRFKEQQDDQCGQNRVKKGRWKEVKQRQATGPDHSGFSGYSTTFDFYSKWDRRLLQENEK